MRRNAINLNQNVWIVTEDVSGVNIVPCIISAISENVVEMTSKHGIKFTLSEDDLNNVYSTCEAAECIVQRSGKKRSCWY